jgi:hypothetical protein
VTWEQLSASSGMAPNTIRDCYKMMLPYLSQVRQVCTASNDSCWCFLYGQNFRCNAPLAMRARTDGADKLW